MAKEVYLNELAVGLKSMCLACETRFNKCFGGIIENIITIFDLRMKLSRA